MHGLGLTSSLLDQPLGLASGDLAAMSRPLDSIAVVGSAVPPAGSDAAVLAHDGELSVSALTDEVAALRIDDPFDPLISRDADHRTAAQRAFALGEIVDNIAKHINKRRDGLNAFCISRKFYHAMARRLYGGNLPRLHAVDRLRPGRQRGKVESLVASPNVGLIKKIVVQASGDPSVLPKVDWTPAIHALYRKAPNLEGLVLFNCPMSWMDRMHWFYGSRARASTSVLKIQGTPLRYTDAPALAHFLRYNGVPHAPSRTRGEPVPYFPSFLPFTNLAVLHLEVGSQVHCDDRTLNVLPALADALVGSPSLHTLRIRSRRYPDAPYSTVMAFSLRDLGYQFQLRQAYKPVTDRLRALPAVRELCLRDDMLWPDFQSPPLPLKHLLQRLVDTRNLRTLYIDGPKPGLCALRHADFPALDTLLVGALAVEPGFEHAWAQLDAPLVQQLTIRIEQDFPFRSEPTFNTTNGVWESVNPYALFDGEADGPGANLPLRPCGLWFPLTMAAEFLRADVAGLHGARWVKLALSLAPLGPDWGQVYDWPAGLSEKLVELQGVEHLVLHLHHSTAWTEEPHMGKYLAWFLGVRCPRLRQLDIVTVDRRLGYYGEVVGLEERKDRNFWTVRREVKGGRTVVRPERRNSVEPFELPD